MPLTLSAKSPSQYRAILANPQAFNMRAVRLQGIIQNFQRIPRAGGCGRLDAYLITLNDQTGELTFIDRGSCLHRSQSVKPLMTEFAVGDNIEVVIDVSLIFSPNFDSRKVEGNLRWVKQISELAGDGSYPSR